MIHWIPALLYMAAIFAVSSIPDLGPLPGGVSDKSGHVLTYAGLGVLVLAALARWRLGDVTPRRAVLAVVVATLYGISDEWHQSFVPGRSPEWADVVADAVGASLGVALVAAARAWSILSFSARRPGAP